MAGAASRRRMVLHAAAGALLAAAATGVRATSQARVRDGSGDRSVIGARDDTPASPRPLGHRVFPLQPGRDERTARRLLFWYPAAAPVSRQGPAREPASAGSDASVADGRHPVVLFSHGFLGAADQSRFITENLARMGYVVAAVDHDDAIDRGARIAFPDVLRPGDWTGTTQIERRNDLVALLDRMTVLDADPDSFLHRRLDLARIGAVGHSLGGYAVLGMAGARTAWREPRIRAVAGLSPYTAPYLLPGRFGAIDIPVMLQGGTFDIGITPLLPRFHALLRAPRYLLVLRDVHHLGWTDFALGGRTTVEATRSGNTRWIFDYLLAFLEQHLRGVDRRQVLLRANPALESLASDPG
jgi:predicted dienelactone hydrolase